MPTASNQEETLNFWMKDLINGSKLKVVGWSILSRIVSDSFSALLSKNTSVARVLWTLSTFRSHNFASCLNMRLVLTNTANSMCKGRVVTLRLFICVATGVVVRFSYYPAVLETKKMRVPFWKAEWSQRSAKIEGNAYLMHSLSTKLTTTFYKSLLNSQSNVTCL